MSATDEYKQRLEHVRLGHDERAAAASRLAAARARGAGFLNATRFVPLYDRGGDA
jgi:hypothetical protein